MRQKNNKTRTSNVKIIRGKTKGSGSLFNQDCYEAPERWRGRDDNRSFRDKSHLLLWLRLFKKFNKTLFLLSPESDESFEGIAARRCALELNIKPHPTSFVSDRGPSKTFTEKRISRLDR